jgi:TRAP-type C4-dicarboxylate transport system permease large subunit
MSTAAFSRFSSVAHHHRQHSVLPFMVAQAIVMFLLAPFPQIVMWPLQ